MYDGFREFPKCQYHPDGRSVVVANAGEQLALGPGWVDVPSQLPLVGSELELPVADVLAGEAPVPPRRPRGRPRKG